ncbi:MAG TPA: 50S ribosomal protein L1 [Gemmataceae bacterium]|jgi:large subunit ribosomal protein L1|nr:50S ribosomal protein L1 [Gemmataceae bacterium]
MAKKTAPPPAETEAAAPAPPQETPPAAVAAPTSAPPPVATGAAAPTETKKKSRPGRGTPRGKKLKNHLKNQQAKLAKEGPAPLKKAVSLLKSMKRAKFDETVEVHMWLGIDPTQSDQLVRGAVSLPHGIGKSVRVAVFCQADNVAKAKEAGADFAGAQDLIEKVQKENFLDFDVALATQDMMGQVSRLGKVLGPRGLMPTPKAGTVIPAGGDVAKAVNEFKAGKVEYRADKSGNIHAGVGKMSFDENKIVENATVFIDQVRAAKPSGVKGHYIKSVTLSATMSPGIPLQV